MARSALAWLILALALLTGCNTQEPAYETSVAVSRAADPGKLAVFAAVTSTDAEGSTTDSGFRVFSIAPGEAQALALDSKVIPGRRYLFKVSVAGSVSTPVLQIDTTVLGNGRVIHRSLQKFSPMGIGPNNSFKVTPEGAPQFSR